MPILKELAKEYNEASCAYKKHIELTRSFEQKELKPTVEDLIKSFENNTEDADLALASNPDALKTREEFSSVVNDLSRAYINDSIKNKSIKYDVIIQVKTYNPEHSKKLEVFFKELDVASPAKEIFNAKIEGMTTVDKNTIVAMPVTEYKAFMNDFDKFKIENEIQGTVNPVMFGSNKRENPTLSELELTFEGYKNSNIHKFIKSEFKSDAVNMYEPTYSLDKTINKLISASSDSQIKENRIQEMSKVSKNKQTLK